MKTTAFFRFFSLFVFLLFVQHGVNGQLNGPGGVPMVQDTSWDSFGNGTNRFAPFGGCFTPKGTLKALVIYAGLYEPGVFDEINCPIVNWPETDDYPFNQHNNVPEYANGGVPAELFFNEVSQLTDPNYSNYNNLTRFYYDMSMGQFILLGDVFRDPDPESPTYGQPIRINVSPTGLTSNPWNSLNKRIIAKIRAQYQNYWDTIWHPFDNKTNSPGYVTDNSVSAPDNKIDFLVIIWRYSKPQGNNETWYPEPLPGLAQDFYSERAVSSTLISYNWPNPDQNFYYGYNFSTGFSLFNGKLNADDLTSFAPHEIAHSLYSCPHLMGANSTVGNRFTKPSAGWGMMSSSTHSMVCANSWERWLLGWTEIMASNEPTDIQDISSLNSTGIYFLRDYLTTGDVIRIKIPHSDTYLWIENHSRANLRWDSKPWAGKSPSADLEVIPEIESGIYMFTEQVASSRDNFTLRVDSINRVNAIWPLNAQGNYDYSRSDLPMLNSEGKIDDRYYWGNPVYTFQRVQENPISGINPWLCFRDDYPTFLNGSYLSTPNNVISNYYNEPNGCMNCELNSMVRESNGSNTNMLFGNTFGRNSEAIENFSRRSDAFQMGDEISKSGLIPVLNQPKFLNGTFVEEYLINGLKINVLNKDLVTGSYSIKIQFDDYNLRNNKRWTGKIGLKDLTNNNNPDLVINQNVILTIDKSGIPNRLTKINNEFIDTTIFTCYSNASIEIHENGILSLINESQLVFKTGSTLKL